MLLLFCQYNASQWDPKKKKKEHWTPLTFIIKKKKIPQSHFKLHFKSHIFNVVWMCVCVLRLLRHIIISGIHASATQLRSHLIEQDIWTAAVMSVHLTPCFHFRVCIWAWAVMAVKPSTQHGVKQNTHQCLIQPSFIIAAVLMPQWWVGTH